MIKFPEKKLSQGLQNKGVLADCIRLSEKIYRGCGGQEQYRNSTQPWGESWGLLYYEALNGKYGNNRVRREGLKVSKKRQN